MGDLDVSFRPYTLPGGPKTKRQLEKRAWYLKNRERILKDRKKAASDSICGLRKAQRKYGRKRRSKASYKEYQKRYYNKHKTRIKARCHAWYKKFANEHPDKILNSCLKAKYGVTLADYNRLLSEQNNCCAICGISFEDSLKTFKKRLSVDHCHNSSAVRGLLCHLCNVGLGSFKDNEKLLFAALQYLQKGPTACQNSTLLSVN